MDELRAGVVGMIDALGFKGIWKDADAVAAAIGTLKSAVSTANGMLGYYASGLGPRLALTMDGQQPKMSVRYLSDTLIVALEVPSSQTLNTDAGEPVMTILLDMVCQALSYVARKAAQETRPLVYRGTVAAGRLLTDGSFIIGPAVDEAAELMNLAEGAFIWCAPSALRIPAPTHAPDLWSTYAVRYGVPLKKGAFFETVTVAPFADTNDSRERSAIRAGFANAMASERLDVSVKRQNTMRYLDYVDKAHLIRRGSPAT